jgi:hypothetical protein
VWKTSYFHSIVFSRGLSPTRRVVRLSKTSEIPEGQVKTFNVDREKVLVVNVQGVFYAPSKIAAPTWDTVFIWVAQMAK